MVVTDEILKELRQLRSRLFGEDSAYQPPALRLPSSLRPGAEAGEFCFEGGKLKIVAADGSIKTFSPDS